MGALTVFIGWFNLIILLKNMPFTGELTIITPCVHA